MHPIKFFVKKTNKKIEQLNNILLAHHYIDYDLRAKNTVFLAGTSRSGTTWLSNIINYNNDFRYIFEPFFEKEVEISQHFNEKQYIRPNSKNNYFLEQASLILSGRVRSEWSDRFNQRFISHQRLIKSIRANLFLKWLRLQFPNLPIIFLLRHPCAVAISKVKLNWQRSIKHYLAQEELVADFLYPFLSETEESEKVYQTTGDSFTNHIFSWCIENYVPLKQIEQNDNIHILFYEQLCTNPELELQRLFSYMGIKYKPEILVNFQQASQLSRKDSAVITGESVINSWQNHISDRQTRQAMEILDLFGLNAIYSESSMPNTNNFKNINSSKIMLTN